MSSTHTEVIGSPLPPPHAPARRRLGALVAIGALVVGLLGGYAVRRSTEPAPVTKTVTTTVTRTVPAAPYSTSTDQTVYVTYDGSQAYYSGPNQVKANTKLTVHVVSTAAHPIGIVAAAKLGAGRTWEQVVAEARSHLVNENTPSDVSDLSWTELPDDLVVTASPGLWAVWIGLPPPTHSQAVAVTFILAS